MNAIFLKSQNCRQKKLTGTSTPNLWEGSFSAKTIKHVQWIDLFHHHMLDAFWFKLGRVDLSYIWNCFSLEWLTSSIICLTNFYHFPKKRHKRPSVAKLHRQEHWTVTYADYEPEQNYTNPHMKSEICWLKSIFDRPEGCRHQSMLRIKCSFLICWIKWTSFFICWMKHCKLEEALWLKETTTYRIWFISLCCSFFFW